MNKNPTTAEEQYELGKAYHYGTDGIPEDKKEAVEWYTKAAERGHIEAQMALGQIYYIDSDAVNFLIEKAKHWYTKAAEQGNEEAQVQLGFIYDTLLHDFEKSFYWYTKAAEQGHARSQSRVGRIYENGAGGVQQDKGKAKYWYAKAAAQGDESAQKNLKKLNRGGCYVATCIYGSCDCPEVWALRMYRDTKLSKSWFGRLFIQAYYAISPKIVELYGHRKWFNRLFKPILNKLVSKLQNNSVDRSPHSGL